VRIQIWRQKSKKYRTSIPMSRPALEALRREVTGILDW
jgi:hypothetical protein